MLNDNIDTNVIKKILFIASDDSNKSGAFLSMVKLIVLLRSKYGIEAKVVMPRTGNGEMVLQENSIPYVIVHSYNWAIPINASPVLRAKVPVRFALNFRSIKEIEKIIEDFSPDVVHINTTWTYVGAVAAYRRGIPVVWHLREFLEEDQNAKLWWRKKCYGVINRADTIIAISDALRTKYTSILSKNKLIRIYNGIDVDRFYDGSKDVFMTDKAVFSCVGGLYPGKDQGLLIKACGNLIKAGVVDFHLYIVGIGGEEERLKQLTKELSLEDYISFPGFEPHPEKYYKQSDVVFMVSKAEAFGRVTVEAMLSGALIIGSDSGATPEILKYGDVGYLYKKGDVEDLTRTILYVMQHRDEAREKMRAGREMAVRYFTAERNAQEIYDIYRTVCDSHSTSH